MTSYGIRGMVKDRHIRILACDTKEIVSYAQKVHDMFPTSTAALGRVMSISALMAMNIKESDEKIQVQIDGNGPIGNIFVEAKSSGDIKGYVQDPTVYLKYNDTGKLAVGLAVGTDGFLKVSRFSGFSEPFSSQVALRTGEIGDDFAYYFALSEQVPSLVSVGVLVDVDHTPKAAGALIAQLLPDHTEDDIEYLETIQKEMQPISSLLDKGMIIEEVTGMYFKDVQIMQRQELHYHCDCSRERFLRGLMTLNKNDLDEILTDEKITIKCEFCDKIYEFTKDDILEYQNHVQNR